MGLEHMKGSQAIVHGTRKLEHAAVCTMYVHINGTNMVIFEQ